MSWFNLRRESEIFYGLAPSVACPGRAGGPQSYVAMNLKEIVLPYDAAGNALANSDAERASIVASGKVSNIVWDESPSLIEPLEESRYLSKNYDNTVGGHKNKGEKRR